MESNPAITIGAVGSVLGAMLVLLKSFGISMTSDQESAIKDLLIIAGPLVIGFVTRSFVVSPATAREKVQEAHAAGQAGAPVPSVKA